MLGLFRQDKRGAGSPAREERFLGYPSNHEFVITDGHLQPYRELNQRWKKIRKQFPDGDSESMLDLACCRGFYILKAIEENLVERGLGVDVSDHFVSQAERARKVLDESKARFIIKGIEDLRREMDAYGGPFDVVLLTGAYHYFFWGSGSIPGFLDHEYLLGTVAALCSRRLIFSARLEVNRLPDKLQAHAASEPTIAERYTERDFLLTAENWFDIRKVGRMGKDGLFVLDRKAGK